MTIKKATRSAPAGTPSKAAAPSKATAPSKAVGMVLFPSAGTDASFPAMHAIETAVSSGPRGIPVRRVDFPYRVAGRRFPDRHPQMIAAVVEATTEMAASLGVGTDQIIVGGRSMGGRMASMAVAAGLPVAGLVSVSYPLHPPGQWNDMRDAHFPDIRVPMLFVSGVHDAFGSPEELTEAAKKIKGRVAFKFLEGNKRRAGHELYGQDDAVADLVAAWVRRRS